MVPERVPVTRTLLANCAIPVTVNPLATDKFPLTSRIGVPKTWNVPVVAATVVPVNVVPVTLVNVPFVKKTLFLLHRSMLKTLNNKSKQLKIDN